MSIGLTSCKNSTKYQFVPNTPPSPPPTPTNSLSARHENYSIYTLLELEPSIHSLSMSQGGYNSSSSSHHQVGLGFSVADVIAVIGRTIAKNNRVESSLDLETDKRTLQEMLQNVPDTVSLAIKNMIDAPESSSNHWSPLFQNEFIQNQLKTDPNLQGYFIEKVKIEFANSPFGKFAIHVNNNSNYQYKIELNEQNLKRIIDAGDFAKLERDLPNFFGRHNLTNYENIELHYKLSNADGNKKALLIRGATDSEKCCAAACDAACCVCVTIACVALFCVLIAADGDAGDCGNGPLLCCLWADSNPVPAGSDCCVADPRPKIIDSLSQYGKESLVRSAPPRNEIMSNVDSQLHKIQQVYRDVLSKQRGYFAPTGEANSLSNAEKVTFMVQWHRAANENSNYFTVQAKNPIA